MFILFALVCCISALTVSSNWADDEDEVDTEIDDLDEEVFLDAEDKRMLYEEILDELIAASDPKSPKSCNARSKVRKYNKCKAECKKIKPVKRTCISGCLSLHCPKTRPG